MGSFFFFFFFLPFPFFLVEARSRRKTSFYTETKQQHSGVWLLVFFNLNLAVKLWNKNWCIFLDMSSVKQHYNKSVTEAAKVALDPVTQWTTNGVRLVISWRQLDDRTSGNRTGPLAAEATKGGPETGFRSNVDVSFGNLKAAQTFNPWSGIDLSVLSHDPASIYRPDGWLQFSTSFKS